MKVVCMLCECSIRTLEGGDGVSHGLCNRCEPVYIQYIDDSAEGRGRELSAVVAECKRLREEAAAP